MCQVQLRCKFYVLLWLIYGAKKGLYMDKCACTEPPPAHLVIKQKIRPGIAIKVVRACERPDHCHERHIVVRWQKSQNTLLRLLSQNVNFFGTKKCLIFFFFG